MAAIDAVRGRGERLPRLLLTLIAALAAGLVACMLVGGRWAQLLFGGLAMVLPPALMALGALRRGRLGGAGAVLAVLALLLEGGYIAMVALAGQVAGGRWFAGLPLAAAVFLVTVWLLPLGLVSLAYGLTFSDHGIGDEDLRRLRSLARHRAQPRADANATEGEG